MGHVWWKVETENDATVLHVRNDIMVHDIEPDLNVCPQGVRRDVVEVAAYQFSKIFSVEMFVEPPEKGVLEARTRKRCRPGRLLDDFSN